MNRLTKLVETFHHTKSGWEDVFSHGYELYPGEEAVRDPYLKNSLVYTCISTTSRSIAQIPLTVYEVSDQEGWVPVKDDSPWAQLFKRPNFFLDRYHFIEAVITRLYMDGSVFAVGTPPNSAVPGAIWLLPRRCMTPKTDSKNGQLLGWTYAPRPSLQGANDSGSSSLNTQGSVYLFTDEVAHIHFYNPYDSIFGLSPLEVLKLPIMSDFKAAIWNNQFFDENAVPGGILSTDKSLGDPQRARISQQMENRHQGFRKAFRMMVLEGGLKYQQAGLSHTDMQFIDLRKYSRDEIIQALGMKKAVISITEDLNYSINKEQKREWWRTTCIPIMHLITGALNFTFFRNNHKLKVMFDTSSIEALQDELKDKVAMALSLNKVGFTANEINKRLQLGFAETEYRNLWYIPVGVVPVSDENPIPPNPYAQGAPSPKGEIGVLEQVKTPKRLASHRVVNARISTTKLDEKHKDMIWRYYVSQLATCEDQFASKVGEVFYTMRKKILTTLYRDAQEASALFSRMNLQNQSIYSKTVADAIGEDFSEEKELLKKATTNSYIVAVQTGIQTLENELGFSVSFSLKDPLAIDYLSLKPIYVGGVNDTIRDQIREELVQGMDAGESIDQLATRLRDIFKEADNRCRTIARTEVIGSSNFGRWASLLSSGLEQKEWYTAMDERVRTRPAGGHVAMHSLVININDSWFFGDGSSVRYPGDWQGDPEQVINCRCIELPVTGDEEPSAGEE